MKLRELFIFRQSRGDHGCVESISFLSLAHKGLNDLQVEAFQPGLARIRALTTTASAHQRRSQSPKSERNRCGQRTLIKIVQR